MTDLEPTETQDAAETGQGPDCPLYGHYHSEPSDAVKSTVRSGLLLAILGGLLAFGGSIAGRAYWLGVFFAEIGQVQPDEESQRVFVDMMLSGWIWWILLPMVLGGVAGAVGVWQLTAPGSAPDRGNVSARQLSRFLLLAIPYAIGTTFVFRGVLMTFLLSDDSVITSSVAWIHYTIFVLSLALLVLAVARHLDNILAAVGADGRVVAQMFFLSVLVAGLLGLQQDPAEPKLNGLFAVAVGLAAFFGVLTMLKVRTELTGVSQPDLDGASL